LIVYIDLRSAEGEAEGGSGVAIKGEDPEGEASVGAAAEA
jgi:hypothetical protein